MPCTQRPVAHSFHQWLDAFRKAEQGDEHQRSVLQRFGRLIGARRDHDRMRSIVNDSLVRPLLLPSQAPDICNHIFHSLGNTVSSTVLYSQPPSSSLAYTMGPSHGSNPNRTTYQA